MIETKEQQVGLQTKSLMALLYAVVGLGVLLRLIVYLSNRSLWMDEACLAVNVISKSYKELLGTLTDNQCAPIGFLFIERFFVNLLGSSEPALRFFPFLCGIGSIFLSVRLSRKILSPAAAIIGAFLFAVSYYLVYYSSEVKQFGPDVFVALGLICLACGIIQADKQKPVPYIVFGLCGVLAIFLSHPAVFVLFGLGVAGLLFCLRRKNKWLWAGWLILCALWAAAFLVNFHFFLSKYHTADFVIKHWQDRDGFFPVTDGIGAMVVWFVKKTGQVLKQPGGFSMPFVYLLPLAVGLWGLFRKKQWFVIASAAVVFSAVVASAFERFPFGSRVIMFIAPLLLIFLAEGIAVLVSGAWHGSHLSAIALLICFFYFPIQKTAGLLAGLDEKEHIRPVLNYLEQKAADGDVVYVYRGTWVVFDYYQPRYTFPKKIQMVRGQRETDQQKYSNQLDSLMGNPRVWFLFTHVWEGPDIDDRLFIKFRLDGRGALLGKFQTESAWLYLYDLTGRTGRQDSN